MADPVFGAVETIIRHRFTVTDPDGTTFSDALNLTAAESAALDTRAMGEMAAARHGKWKTAVAELSREKTKEELQALKVRTEAEIVALTERKADLEAAIAVKG